MKKNLINKIKHWMRKKKTRETYQNHSEQKKRYNARDRYQNLSEEEK